MSMHSGHLMKTGTQPPFGLIFFILYVTFGHISISSDTQAYLFAYTLPIVIFPFLFPS